MTQKMTSERIKVQNKGLENNLKSLKELKKTKKIKEKELEKEKESTVADRESLENSNVIVSSSNCSARPVSRLHNCTSKLYSFSKEINSVGTSYMAETSLESDVNIEKVKEPASSPNIEGPLITLQERQIDDGMALHASDTAHLQCDNIPRKVNNGHSLSIDDRSNMKSLTGGGLDDSQQLVPKVEEAKEFLGKT